MIGVQRLTIYNGARRPTKVWRATLGGIEADGKTAAEAKANVLDAVETATEGDWLPLVLSFGDQYALVYRDLSGWGYRFGPVTDMTEGRAALGTHITSSDNRAETIRRAKVHLAQAAYPASNGLDFLGAQPEVDAASLLGHLQWLGFQRAYVWRRDEALGDRGGDTQWHAFACEHAHDRQWFTVEELTAREWARGVLDSKVVR